MRKEPIDLFFKIIGWGSSPESHAGNIFLVMRLQLFRQFRRLADAYEQHTSSQRIKRACMSHFEILLAEMTDSGPLDLSDHVGRCPSVWFVYGDDYPFRVVFYVSAEDFAARIQYKCVQFILKESC